MSKQIGPMPYRAPLIPLAEQRPFSAATPKPWPFAPTPAAEAMRALYARKA